MHLLISLLIIYSLFSIGVGFELNELSAAKVIILTSTKNNEQNQKKYKENKITCSHLENLFPSDPNTCPISPIKDYRDIYIKRNAEELWEYQRRNCNTFIRNSRIGKIILFMIAAGTVLFMVSDDGSKKKRFNLY
jgi:hypothetical protein